MALIKPFRALRPAESRAEVVAALPYDVYSRKEAREEARKHPYSFLNIDRPETQFAEDQDMYAPEVYRMADRIMRDWTARGIFVEEENPSLYIYALTMDGRTQTGLAACSSVDDYLAGVIKKHENTLAEKEKDRIRHIDRCSAQTGPIFLAYRDDRVIDMIIEREKEKAPLYDFVSEDGVRHTIWRIDDEGSIQALVYAFSQVPNTYIADGHHRAASAVKAAGLRRLSYPDYDGTEEFNWFLSVLFPASQLRIYDYNRVVKDLNGLGAEEFLEQVSKEFTITPVSGKGQPYRPVKPGEYGMFLGDLWYRLEAKPEIRSDDPVAGLDVSILQDHLLAPILGIGDPKTDSRIGFVGGIRGLKELERRVDGGMAAAFSMYPTSIGELFAVADAGLLMPPKSTWFEPKLRSGLLIHTFER
ncbi:MAG: DUF1015 domain-containing protein [Lachnospiraceae bacterium]|nr:DUF1015 domain-containing protein [Lachnospiraceae bacterium]